MNYRQIYARKAECEKRIKEVCPQATHESGIYCFTRVDEDGFKFAYVGQASKSLLTRLGDHLVGYQHIDLSIKKHGLYSQENPYGYKVDILCKCPAEECNEKEQYYIKKAADAVDDGLDVTDMLYSVTAVNMAGAHKQVKRGSVLAQDVCGHWEIMTADEWELRKDDTISDGSSDGL